VRKIQWANVGFEDGGSWLLNCKGATNHGMYTTSRIWKRQEIKVLLISARKEHSPTNTQESYSSRRPISDF
jgi:hypothetical protein